MFECPTASSGLRSTLISSKEHDESCFHPWALTRPPSCSKSSEWRLNRDSAYTRIVAGRPAKSRPVADRPLPPACLDHLLDGQPCLIRGERLFHDARCV